MGVSYKKDVGDVRESPNLEVIKLLIEKGAKVVYNDPYVPEFFHFEVKWCSQELTQKLLSEVDCVLILTAHSSYDWELVYENANLVLDTRNVTNAISSEKIHKL